MEELYINNKLVELKHNSISLTFQINDLAELKDRQANYSNNIRIPITPNNKLIFEMLGIVGSTSRIPYTNVTVKYVYDGIELIKSGKGVIKNVNNNYNLTIYDGNIDLLKTISSKLIRTLDWTAHNHTLDMTTYLNSFTNTSGYIYAFADFYDVDKVYVDRQSPSIFVHTLWDMIFVQNGLTYTGDIFTNTDFLSRVITPTKGFVNTIVDSSSVNVLYTSFSGNIAYSSPTRLSRYDTIKSGTFTSDSSYKLDIQGNVTINSADYAVIALLVNNKQIWSQELYSFYSENLTFSQIINIYANNLDTYELKIYSITFYNGSSYQTDIDYNITTFKLDSLSRKINIDFSTLFNDETQIDFLKDIMQHYGLIFKKTSDTNYDFIQIKNLITDKANAEDWSDKYSNFFDEQYKPNYAQKNYAKYLYDDNNNSTQTYGDGVIEIANVNLNKTKDLFTSIFKASKYMDGSSQYYKAKLWQLNDNNIVEQLENGMKIFSVLTESRSLTYGFSDASTTTKTITTPYLDFVNYQTDIDNNYKEFKNIINNYKKITVELKLNLIDIYNLDFFKLKYFNQLGQYYYLNKVVSYKKNKVTKVELIQV
jgi:hypothetical protein